MTLAPRQLRPGRLGRWALGALLLAMAVGQLANPAGFVDVLETYRVGGPAVAAVLAAGLVGGELLAGLGLLSSDARRHHGAASAALAVATAWTALGVQAFARGLALDNCGCFGVYAAQPLRWWVLVEDAKFVAFALWIRARSSRTTRREPVRSVPSA